MPALTVLVALILAATPAVAGAAERTIGLSATTSTVEFSGTRSSGTYAVFYGFVGEPCLKSNLMYCDDTLIEVAFPSSGVEDVSLSVFGLGNGTDDFDAYLYRINPDGSLGEQVDYSNFPGSIRESVGWQIATDGVIDSPRWLLRVPYYDVQDAAFTATTRVVGLPVPVASPTPSPTPSATPSPTPTASPTPSPSPVASVSPTPTPTPSPNSTPTPTATPTAAPTADRSSGRPPAPQARRGDVATLPLRPRPRLRIVARRHGRIVVQLSCPFRCRASVASGKRVRRLKLRANRARTIRLRSQSRRVRAVVIRTGTERRFVLRRRR